MPTATATDVLEKQHEQRAAAKRATLEQLLAKQPAYDDFTTKLPGADAPVSFLFVSIGHVDYDKLITKCPPTTEQLAQGESYNLDKFAPLLLAAVCQEPVLDVDEWGQVWSSTAWNRGESMALFGRAVELCNRGLDVNPTELGSGPTRRSTLS